MRWDILGNDSIKLVLTREDVAELGLLSAYKGIIYRGELERILETNFKESGFIITGCKALVQVFIRKNDSLEIIVTKLDLHDDEKDIDIRSCFDENQQLYFIFGDADALINGCLRVKPIESNLFYADTGEFIINIPAIKCSTEISEILREYAYETDDEEIEGILNFVTKNPIGKIHLAFNKLKY